jgi:hypothetical protein
VEWVREDPNSNATAIAAMDTVPQPPLLPATEISPWDGVQQAPQPSATGQKLLTLDDRPPGTSSCVSFLARPLIDRLALTKHA